MHPTREACDTSNAVVVKGRKTVVTEDTDDRYTRDV